LNGAVDEGPRFQVHGNLAGHEDEVAGPHGRRQGHLRGDVVQLDHVPGHGHPPLVYKCAQNYFPGAAPNSSCARTGRAGFVAPAADRSGKPDPGACCPSTAGRPVNMLNSRFPASAKRWREMPDPGTCRCAKRACRRDPRRGEEPDPSIALPEGRDGMAHDGGNASQGPMRPWAAGDNGTPAGQVSQLVREGCRLLELSRLAGAQRKFQQALRLCATSVAARSHLAFTYLLQEKHEQAAAEAEAALRFDPDHVLALTTLARAQAEGGREPEAKEAARRALRAFYARWRAGEAQRAEVAWVAAALAAVEDDQRLYQLYRWCVRGAAGPWDAMALTWLGVAAFNQGRYREARWLWRSAMGQTPARDDVLKAYLFVVDAIETERVPPFALDYRLQLESPPPKAEEPPGYVRAVALRTLWQGEDDRAREAALDLLSQLQDPWVSGFLFQIVRDPDLPDPLKMKAGAWLVERGFLAEDEPLEMHVDGALQEVLIRPRGGAKLPRDAAYWFERALEARERGDDAAAEDNYRKVLDAAPDFVPALVNLA